jgi:hypothetical protein
LRGVNLSNSRHFNDDRSLLLPFEMIVVVLTTFIRGEGASLKRLNPGDPGSIVLGSAPLGPLKGGFHDAMQVRINTFPQLTNDGIFDFWAV